MGAPTHRLIISDTHFHNWTAFVTNNGMFNSRLLAQIEAFEQAVNHAIEEAGGPENLLVCHGGDMFHTRGSVPTSVLNMVSLVIKRYVTDGVRFLVIPGNHDLESKDIESLHQASQFFLSHGQNGVDCRGLIYEPESNTLMLAWMSDQEKMLKSVGLWWGTVVDDKEKIDLFLHAPLNNVIPGLPNHGIDPAELAKFGFRNVFVGHYHNHKVFPGNVVSIGALMHQSFGDVGSKAGYIIQEIATGDWQHFETTHPRFIDLDDDLLKTDDSLLELITAGNFIRVKTAESDELKIAGIRNRVEHPLGAKACTIIARPAPTAGTTRTVGSMGIATAGSVKLEEAVSSFIKGLSLGATEIDVTKESLRILADAEVVK